VFVLCNTRKPDLIRTTLDTLSVYLTWVPLGYIFESNLLQILLQLFPQPAFRNVALQVCCSFDACAFEGVGVLHVSLFPRF
jgi:exportin-1